jgi:hypothetical protein
MCIHQKIEDHLPCMCCRSCLTKLPPGCLPVPRCPRQIHLEMVDRSTSSIVQGVLPWPVWSAGLQRASLDVRSSKVASSSCGWNGVGHPRDSIATTCKTVAPVHCAGNHPSLAAWMCRTSGSAHHAKLAPTAECMLDGWWIRSRKTVCKDS